MIGGNVGGDGGSSPVGDGAAELAAADVRSSSDALGHEELTALVKKLDRPQPSLAIYYALASLVTGPLFPIVLIASLIRYKTLRYRFDEEGVSVRWGILFRREVSLTYSRIQDIHLASNAIERHLGLGRVLVQTASASSAAEIKIEGFEEFEAIRDYLYSRMRGAGATSGSSGAVSGAVARPSRSLSEVLDELALELDLLRQSLADERQRAGASADPRPRAPRVESKDEAAP